MGAHSPSSPVIQPVLPDQPQAAWAPWLREIAGAVNQLGAKTTELAAGGGGGTGPAGPPGPTGPTGPAGATGATGPAGSANMSGMVAGQIPIAATATSVTSSTSSLAASFMPPYTGDVTSPAGGTVNTLVTVNANVGTFQGITVNAKGLVTAAANQSYLTASGVSGMTAGQIPIAASATTITSSGNLSGAVTTSGSLVTTLANNAVATANITASNVTYAKIQNVTAARLLGNPTGSAAAPSEISLGTNLAFAGTVLNGLATPITVANGGTNKTSWTAGSLVYAGAGGAALQEDNANLFFNGNLSVGIGSPNAKLHVRGGSTAAAIDVLVLAAGPTGSDTTTVLARFADYAFTATGGTITRNGAAAVLYNTTSDERLKADVTETSRGLESLLRLQVHDFRMGDDPHQQGLMAQELYEVYPDAVHVGGDDPDKDPWGIDYGRITPLLVRGLQQQQAQLQQQQAQIDRLLDLLEGLGAR